MKRAFAMLVIPIAGFTFTACGSANDGSESMSGHSMSTTSAPAPSAAGQHNDQDVTFAQGMIPHHQQAIQMAELATSRASMPEVKQLAAAIKDAQGPEIQQMTGWLDSWNATVPSPDMHMGHDMGDGMMSEQDMKKLEKLSGNKFDKAFLTMMIKHHEGAITMARTEQTSGMSSAAKTLAGTIVTSQSAEITKMRTLLEKM
ncbi:DUF305 domain-containing protein [Actinomadura sp. HBU206391]|uniref:DUF305 domain-containing protein n=1 Tax=Actinomadura sp. HBU206391 TaxID=2731692 RepID=UPI00164F58C0|nr:DUF305 domain-containing protein [Actinomadura sp. HBU206391]MBC6460168.1 DUF305 domain-containing protein [Actinomadura sp. HBU206391]